MAGDHSQRPEDAARRARLRETLILFVGVPLGWGAVVLAIYWIVASFTVFRVQSGSMVPALEPSEIIIVARDYYRAHLPNSGDLVMFPDPHPRRNGVLIKRVIGLPGEAVQLDGGIVHIGRKPVGIQPQKPYTLVDRQSRRVVRDIPQYEETLPSGQAYRIIEINGNRGPYDSTMVHITPDNHYFVLGDNRDNSSDSRGFGPVKADTILHRPLFIVWSGNRARIGMRVR